VHRVVLSHVAVAWLLAPVAGFLSDTFEWPAWVVRALVFVLVLGLPSAAVLAWLFEGTAAGPVRDESAAVSTWLRVRPHRRFDLAVAALLLLAVGCFAMTHDWRVGAVGVIRGLRAAPFVCGTLLLLMIGWIAARLVDNVP
jgi:hypothetical protein